MHNTIRLHISEIPSICNSIKEDKKISNYYIKEI
jgi:hypothetical protein